MVRKPVYRTPSDLEAFFVINHSQNSALYVIFLNIDILILQLFLRLSPGWEEPIFGKRKNFDCLMCLLGLRCCTRLLCKLPVIASEKTGSKKGLLTSFLGTSQLKLCMGCVVIYKENESDKLYDKNLLEIQHYKC